jgi:endo-alpha-1,4-polygalactosaminidase (GH114 family)
MARPSKPMASRFVACVALGILLVIPAAADAQSAAEYGAAAGKLKRGDWQGAYKKQAAQRDDDGVPTADPAFPRQAQAQPPAPGAPPGTPPGRVRIQGRDPAAAPVAVPPPAGAVVDTREQMRKFVQSISTFARRQSRDFTVVTEGGLDLLVKRDPIDETKVAPARGYMHAIDGVMVEGLYFDKRVFGEPTSEARRARLQALTDTARENGLKVLVVDYTADQKTIEESYVRNRQRGYVSYAAPAPLIRLNTLAKYPPRPFGENSDSILSLGDVRNFAYIGDSAAFGRVDEYALAMHRNNYDLLVTSVFHGRDPLSRRAVDTLKFKQIGARRLVFASIDIGSAASYRYYWKPNWREGSPAFIGAPFPDDPDRHHVEFWRPEWQRLVAGDEQSYVFGVIAQGFDGVVLRGIEEAYRFFEGGEDQRQQEEEEERQRKLRQQQQSGATVPGAAAASPAPPTTAPPPAAPATAPASPQPAAPGAPTRLTPAAPAPRPQQ